jgi:hypothetical protein
MRHESYTAFALKFREQYFLEPARLAEEDARRREAAKRLRGALKRRGKTAEPERSDTDTDAEARQRDAARAGVAAFLLAAAILLVFNSDGFTEYTRDLAEVSAGRPLYAVAVKWDAEMDRIGAKRLGVAVHRLVVQVRAAHWIDIAGLFAAPGDARAAMRGKAVPAYTGSLPEQGRAPAP